MVSRCLNYGERQYDSKRKKPPFSLENSGFYGGRYRTRTCDPLHVKRHGYFFLIISAYFQCFLFHSICFSALSAHKVSTCSTAVCDWLCGQFPPSAQAWAPYFFHLFVILVRCYQREMDTPYTGFLDTIHIPLP